MNPFFKTSFTDQPPKQPTDSRQNNQHQQSMKEDLRDKFMKMSDEERENFKQKWKDRFRGRC